MKIKAAVLQAMGAQRPYQQSQPLIIEELDLDPPGDNEVLIQIKAAGLCHSDLSVIDGNRPRPIPMALGHEAAGVVKTVGSGITDLAVGDHVVGLGGVGLNSVLGALVAGASEVIAIDLDDQKLALAKELGATHTFNSGQPNAVEDIKAVTAGGVDCAIEMAGSEKALEFAYQITRRGGITVTGGLAHPDKKVAIQQVSLVAEERTLRGSYVGSCVPVRDVPRYVTLFQQGKLPVDRLLSRVLTLDEINDGFEQLATGKAVRQVIEFA